MEECGNRGFNGTRRQQKLTKKSVLRNGLLCFPQHITPFNFWDNDIGLFLAGAFFGGKMEI